MFKKSLLLSMTIMSLAPIQAAQRHQLPPPPPPAHCPPCPCGGVNGWVLIPAGPGGMPCNQGAHKAEGIQAQQEPAQEPAGEVAQPYQAPKRSLHPPRTAEQEQLERDLKNVKPKIYLRVNPNDPQHKQEGEWGKELHGKVYFKRLGNWEHDPTVSPTDVANEGQVKRNIGFFEGLFKKSQPQQQPQRQARTSTPTRTQAVTAAQQPQEQAQAMEERTAAETAAPPPPVPTENAAPPPPPPPPPSASRKLGKAPAKKWAPVRTTQPVLTVPHATSGQGVRGPATYDPDVPGAPGTAEEALNPVNRAPGE